MNEPPAISATTSTLSATELGRFTIQKYGLDDSFECQLLRTGINHTYLISNGTTKFILRVYFINWKTELEIAEELRLLTLLADHGVSVSHGLPDSDGNHIQKIQAPEGLRFSVLFTFADGEKVRFLSDKTCFTIGSVIAGMHAVTLGKNLKRTDLNRESLLHSAFVKIRTIFSDELPEMTYLKDNIERISRIFNSDRFLACPNGIVHLDIWYDNMSVRNENTVTLFDFDNCGNGKLILDVAYFCKQLFHIENDKAIFERKVAHFLQGYQRERTLSESELAAIPECGAAIFVYYLGMQASRFDWSNIFLSENYLRMYVGRIKAWLDYFDDPEKRKLLLPADRTWRGVS